MRNTPFLLNSKLPESTAGGYTICTFYMANKSASLRLYFSALKREGGEGRGLIFNAEKAKKTQSTQSFLVRPGRRPALPEGICIFAFLSIMLNWSFCQLIILPYSRTPFLPESAPGGAGVSRVERGERVEGALRAILGNRLGEEPGFIMGICNYENKPL